MSSRKSALPGIDSPASLRFFPSITLQKSSSESFPRPTSIIVPTTALTIFLKNRLAVISKYQVVSPVCIHSALVTWHSVVFTSLCALQKAPKSS